MQRDFGLIRDRQEIDVIIKILNSALEAADPARAVERQIAINSDYLDVAGRRYPLKKGSNIYVIGVGKAVISMTEGLCNVLGDRLLKGVVVSKNIPEVNHLPVSINILKGSHPVPDENSINSADNLLRFLEECKEDDLVFCLISGGGSALITCPVAGVSLEDIQALTRILLSCGAEIGEINALRKHLDLVKGGGLARKAYPAQLVPLILSDVIGSPLDVIASGPTVADPSSFQDAIAIIKKYDLQEKVPFNILNALQRGIDGKSPETVKLDDPCVQNIHNAIIGDNFQSAFAAMKKAQEEGFSSQIMTSYLHGEASQAGMILGSILHQIAATNQPVSRPACLVVGGETTVSLKGKGLGGRNLELALGSVAEISGLNDVALISLATDGEDGPTDAAGAIVSGETYLKGIGKGMSPEEFLIDNDSYHYFEKLGSLIKTGSTGTNVNDLTFLFAF